MVAVAPDATTRGKERATMPLFDGQRMDRFAAAHQHNDDDDNAAAAGNSRPQVSRPADDGRAARTRGHAAGNGTTDTELFRRAKFLRAEDRLVLELAFVNHMSLRQISRATGKPPGTVSRTLLRLCNRLKDPVVQVLIDPAFSFPSPEHRQLAIEHIVQGQPIKELAELHQMNESVVRGMVAFARGYCKGVISSRGRGGSGAGAGGRS
jgi:DNA-directed RNA polymerase specialized sigma24 family protein